MPSGPNGSHAVAAAARAASAFLVALKAAEAAAGDRRQFVRVGHIDGDVIEHRDGPGADADQIVDVHGDAIDADGVVALHHLGDQRFRANAVGAEREAGTGEFDHRGEVRAVEDAGRSAQFTNDAAHSARRKRRIDARLGVGGRGFGFC